MSAETVYVVVYDYAGDRHISAVYDNEEAAQAHKDSAISGRVPYYDPYDIEEWDVQGEGTRMDELERANEKLRQEIKEMKSIRAEERA